MKLKDVSDIQSGYITRGRIEPSVDGTHYILQAKDVDGTRYSYRTDEIIRFDPALSRTDQVLKCGDLLFMARGTHNFTIQIASLPGPSLAAACFFVIRVSAQEILPEYLGWYLNQKPVAQYLVQYSGRGVHMPVVRRAALENIEVPVPAMDIQIKIADLNNLMLNEMDLLQKLGTKRKELIAATCLRAIRNH